MPTLKFCLMISALIVVILVNNTHASVVPTTYTPTQFSAIREAQIRISENREALRDGHITRIASDERIAKNMARLNAALPSSLTESALFKIYAPNVAPRMTTVERVNSFFNGVNFLRLGLIAVFTILTMLLIGKHLLKVLINFPKEIWEIMAYSSGLIILVAQYTGYMVINQFWAFFGCLLIGGGLGLSYAIHEDFLESRSGFRKNYVQYLCPGIMLIVFCQSTLITGSTWMGGFAALSLMTLIGFAGEVIPFGFAIGFKDNDALSRGTSAGLIIMTVFMGLNACNVGNSYLNAFEPGALIVGSFVGYLGLLIAGSNRYGRGRRWLIMQASIVATCFAGVISGSILGLKSIQITAGVFLVLWTIEKMVEIPGDGFVPWVLKLMAASGTLYLVVTYGAPIYARHLIN